VIYRRYAGLYFSLCVDVTDNELAYLESIHLFVEILDHYFSNVCELDLVFNFHKARLPRELRLRACCAVRWGAINKRTWSRGCWLAPLWRGMMSLSADAGPAGVPDPGRVHHGRRDPGDEQKGARGPWRPVQPRTTSAASCKLLPGRACRRPPPLSARGVRAQVILERLTELERIET